MTNLIDKLQPGSFRGVPFFVKDTMTVELGRKIVINEIPNADRRTIQDLGLFNRNFTLNVLTTDAGGQDYFSARDALIAAMEAPGEGILVHPLFGSVSVHPSTATVTESIRTLGVTEFSLNFSVAQAQISPADTGDAASLLDNRGEFANSNLQAGLGDVFFVSPRFQGNTIDSIKLLTGYVDTTRAAIKQVGLSAEQLSTANSAIDLFDAGKVLLTGQPLELATETRNLFDSLLDLGLTGQANIALMSSFFSFGDEDVLLIPNNRELTERNRNRKLYNQTVQAHALTQSYRAVGLIEFDNVAALNDVRVVLDNQFESIILDSVLSGEAQDALEELRVEASLFFSQQSVAVFNLVDFNTPTLPITVLTYNLYNSTDNDAQLIALNNISDVGFVSGAIDILGA